MDYCLCQLTMPGVLWQIECISTMTLVVRSLYNSQFHFFPLGHLSSRVRYRFVPIKTLFDGSANIVSLFDLIAVRGIFDF